MKTHSFCLGLKQEPNNIYHGTTKVNLLWQYPGPGCLAQFPTTGGCYRISQVFPTGSRYKSLSRYVTVGGCDIVTSWQCHTPSRDKGSGRGHVTGTCHVSDWHGGNSREICNFFTLKSLITRLLFILSQWAIPLCHLIIFHDSTLIENTFFIHDSTWVCSCVFPCFSLISDYSD